MPEIRKSKPKTPVVVEKKQKDDVYVAPKIVAPPTPFIQTTIPKGTGGVVYEPIGQQQTTPLSYTGLAAQTYAPPTSPGIFGLSSGTRVEEPRNFLGGAGIMPPAVTPPTDFRTLPPPFPGPQLFPPVGPSPEFTVAAPPSSTPDNLARRGGMNVVSAPSQSTWSAGIERLNALLNTPTAALLGGGIDIPGISNVPIANVARFPNEPATPPRLSRAQETESDKLNRIKSKAEVAASSRLAGQAAQYPKVKTLADILKEALSKGTPGITERQWVAQAARMTGL